MIKEREKLAQGKFCSSKKTVSFRSIPSRDTFSCSAGGCPPPVQKLVNRSIYRTPFGCPLFPRIQLKIEGHRTFIFKNPNYGCPQFLGAPLKIAGFFLKEKSLKVNLLNYTFDARNVIAKRSLRLQYNDQMRNSISRKYD